MIENKKINFAAIIIIIFSALGFFYWKNQGEIKEETINNNFSIITLGQKAEEIEVSQGLEGNYKFINKEESYNFILPKSWENVEQMEYFTETKMGDYLIASLFLRGELFGQHLIVSKFKDEFSDSDIKTWAQKVIDSHHVVGELNEWIIENSKVISFKDSESMFFVFFEGESSSYSIINNNEEDIRKIILSGKW